MITKALRTEAAIATACKTPLLTPSFGHLMAEGIVAVCSVDRSLCLMRNVAQEPAASWPLDLHLHVLLSNESGDSHLALEEVSSSCSE